MSTILAEYARRKLAEYLSGDVSLADLYDWLVDHVIASERAQRDPDVRAVIGNTILYLYEYQAGHRTRDEIRRYVAARLEAPAVQPAERTTGV